MKPIFLDNSATTPPLPEVIEAMAEANLEFWSNPSSGYSSADRVRQKIEQARAKVAGLIGASPESLVFASGGTEANNLAILSALESSDEQRTRFVTSELEHASVLALIPRIEAAGYEVCTVAADHMGQVRTEDFLKEIDERTAVVSLQWVNNETGVIQPIHLVAERCAAVGCLFHVDAAQAVGKLPIDFEALPADLLTFTAHKLHGPKGVGAVAFRDTSIGSPMLAGGTQESGIRPGTENTAGILGFGVAAELRSSRMGSVITHVSELRDRFESALTGSFREIRINGMESPRVGNITNVQFPEVEGEALVNLLDLRGVECSQSSACTRARPEPSHVLSAMGLSEEESYSSVRFGFSELNQMEEIDIAIDAVCSTYRELRERKLAIVA